MEDRGTAGMAPQRGEVRGGLDAGDATRMEIESRMVDRGHWRGIDRGQPDMIRWHEIGCEHKDVRCEAVAGVGAASG